MPDQIVPERFSRTALLAGDDMMSALARCSVLVFGVGGVGSWCVEALARTGIGRITIVDSDTVAESNINRQLPALADTVGELKVEVLRRRIARINPDCRVEALAARYTPDSAPAFAVESYDYVIDAIDSLPDKADLILRCTDPSTAPRCGFYSSMGAARRIDPSKIAVAEFWKVAGDGLARALRTRFRRSSTFPVRKFQVVYSTESPLPQPAAVNSAAPAAGEAAAARQPNGTFAHLTAAFGLRLASLVIEDLYRRYHPER